MKPPKETAAGVVQTPEAANIVPIENARSVARKPSSGNGARLDPNSPESLLRHAWALLPMLTRQSVLCRFIMTTGDTQADRKHLAELTSDLRMVVRESYSGQVVAESVPLLPGRRSQP